MADVTDKASLEAAVSRITEETGYINLLVNNAGTLGRRHNAITRPSPFNTLPAQFVHAGSEDLKTVDGIRDFLWKDEVSDWDNTFRTNVSGVWFPSIAFLSLLNKGNEKHNVIQKSQIVTVGSVGAFIRILGTSFTYNPSKAAANHLAKMMATNFMQWGIRSVSPPTPTFSVYMFLSWGCEINSHLSLEHHCSGCLPIRDVSWTGEAGRKQHESYSDGNSR